MRTEATLAAMCNRYGYRHPFNQLPDEFSDLGPVRWADAAMPNTPMEEIRPADLAPIVRRDAQGGVELVRLRWGLIPWFHKGAVRDFKGLTPTRAPRLTGPPRLL